MVGYKPVWRYILAPNMIKFHVQDTVPDSRTDGLTNAVMSGQE